MSACTDHEWAFLRAIVTHTPEEWVDGWKRRNESNVHTHDRYYCRRCLLYRDRPATLVTQDEVIA